MLATEPEFPPRLRAAAAHPTPLRLLQYIRDEALRFAQRYHHLLLRKATIE